VGRAQSSRRVALRNVLATGGTQPGFVPEGRTRGRGSGHRFDGDLLNEVALESQVQDQPRGPVGEHGPERHVQHVEPQTVPVIGPVRHGQSLDEAHVVPA
jgi:hypothetical protein